MRKNTLIKLLAVLAMCFLIGAALVSCGEGEAENADVKTIVSINFSGDKLVVAYSDGTTASVDLPKAEACNHENAIVLVFEEHTANSDGEYLYVCNECGASEVKYEKNHKFVADNKIVAPTCDEHGYTTTHSCEFCGKASEETDVVPALGHDWNEYAFVEGDDCEGGTKKSGCKRCDAFQDDIIVPRADESDFDGIHTVSDWALDAAPSRTVAGQISGSCDKCGKEVVRELPALYVDNAPNKDAYKYEITTPRVYCSDTAIDTFTFKAVAGFEFTDARVGTCHQLKKDGVLTPVEAADINNKKVYSIVDYPSIKAFADKPIDQCDPDNAVLAYYICEGINDADEVCGEVVDVYAVRGHNFAEKVEASCIPVGCVTNGTDVFKCTSCDETDDVTVEADGHEYVYGEVKVVAGKIEGLKLVDGKYTYYAKCTSCGNELDVEVKSYEEVVTVKPTCEEKGYKTVTIVREHDDINDTVVLENVEILETGHSLNGVIMVAADAAKSKVYYGWTAESGIKAFADKPIGEEPTLGYFICEHKIDGVAHVVDVWASTAADPAAPAPAPAAILNDEE